MSNFVILILGIWASAAIGSIFTKNADSFFFALVATVILNFWGSFNK